MAVPTNRGEGAAVVVALRNASGAAMSASDREAMLADVRGNAGSTARLTMTIHSYVQGAAGQAPNALGVRIRDKGMAAMARSYRGLPFLRDHIESDLSARGGTIVASDVVDLADGLRAIVQEVELVKPWAIEGVLDGTIDRFSTSFELVGAASCTICGADYVASWFGLCPGCDHEPGEMCQMKSGAMQCCEVEFENAVGRETSGVSVPAVQRTGIQSISAALAGGDPHQLLARLASELEVEPAALARQLGLRGARAARPTVRGAAADYNAADVEFAQDMIPHHQIAVDMAQDLEANGENKQLATMAGDIISGQSAQMKTLRSWLSSRGEAETDSGGAAMSAPASPAVLGRREIRMSKLAPILIALSLGADADEASALAGIEKLKLERDGLAAKLSASTERLTAIEARIATQEQATRVAKLAALQANGLAEGRYLPAGAVATHVAKLAAAGDVEGLEAYLADMPKGGAVPIGVARQSAGADPTPRDAPGKVTVASLSAKQLKVAAQMGVTPEAFVENLNTKFPHLANQGGR